MVFSYQSLKSVSCGSQPMIHYGDRASFDERQIQPASIDCTLGDKVYTMCSSALPGSSEAVQDLIEGYKSYSFDLTPGMEGHLHKGVCHIIPLREKLSLAEEFFAVFSPKSSIGRCDVFVRVLTDYYQGYDQTIAGYSGDLYLEILPLSFNLKLSDLLSLTQLRIKSLGEQPLSDAEIAKLHSEYAIVFHKEGAPLSNKELSLDNGLYFHVDLDREIVGFEAHGTAAADIHLSMIEAHDPDDFWRPIYRPKNGSLILDPGKFYLLATKERIKIPPTCCGEIVPYDVNTGEFRSHYAGFFDNGFGSEKGTTGVLEVRVREVPLRITDGQRICKMRFEKTDEIPEILYEGNYSTKGASLSKYFKDKDVFWKE